MNELNESTLDPTERFSFGKNWSLFLKNLTDEQIDDAESSLKNKLGCSNLIGKTFLDVGSGSGLFSLAAYRLGATVRSFDYDQDSVDCALFLKEKFKISHDRWSIQQGSVLDKNFLKQFGQVDIVYSWGVLHHTGNMLTAFENVSNLVKPNGQLFIAIYNDQGLPSKGWAFVKKMYVNYPVFRPVLITLSGLWLWKYRIIWGLVRYGNPFKFFIEYSKTKRGMSPYRDLVDWVGGYPFEVAKPETVLDFFRPKGYELERLKTCAGRIGCNEFIMLKKD